MKASGRRAAGLGAAAVVVPFGYAGMYLAATRGGNLHAATAVDLFFLCVGLGVGCVLVWALPYRPRTKILLVLPYLGIVGGASLWFGFWLLAAFWGIGP